MRLSHTAFRLCLGLMAASVHSSSHFQSLDSCPFKREGQCRGRSGLSYIEICAAGRWQEVASGAFRCVAGAVVPLNRSTAWFPAPTTAATTLSSSVALGQSRTATHSDLGPTVSTASTGSPFSLRETTGDAYCRHVPLAKREDRWGCATYKFGGKMASMYYADSTSVFRCDVAPPSDGYFVAFWTQYQEGDASQPQPLNCNLSIRLTNARLGRTATATVIDRCASCVGVGHQVSDPTTPDCLVNGATVDLSPDLWDFLYAGAPPSVYDIEYDGDPYLGWDAEPSLLTALSDGTCAC
jgi:hypothetical protein